MKQNETKWNETIDTLTSTIRFFYYRYVPITFVEHTTHNKATRRKRHINLFLFSKLQHATDRNVVVVVNVVAVVIMDRIVYLWLADTKKRNVKEKKIMTIIVFACVWIYLAPIQFFSSLKKNHFHTRNAVFDWKVNLFFFAFAFALMFSPFLVWNISNSMYFILEIEWEFFPFLNSFSKYSKWEAKTTVLLTVCGLED